MLIKSAPMERQSWRPGRAALPPAPLYLSLLPSSPGAARGLGLGALCRDVLIEYSKLMKYQPEPSAKAWCYDGPMGLRQFGPDPNDAADVLETYPWCALNPNDAADVLETYPWCALKFALWGNP